MISLLEYVPGTSIARVRNRALIAFMYRAGLRLIEALHVRSKDLDPENGIIRVLFAKGQTSRTVGIDETGLDFLRRWEKVRAEMDVPVDVPLMCTSSGRLMGRGYVRQMLYGAKANAKIQKRVHRHGLRHAHAFELVMEGIPLPIVQRQLGHVWIATTAAYVDHVVPI